MSLYISEQCITGFKNRLPNKRILKSSEISEISKIHLIHRKASQRWGKYIAV